jgi:hypothetical protein
LLQPTSSAEHTSAAIAQKRRTELRPNSVTRFSA